MLFINSRHCSIVQIFVVIDIMNISCKLVDFIRRYIWLAELGIIPMFGLHDLLSRTPSCLEFSLPAEDLVVIFSC